MKTIYAVLLLSLVPASALSETRQYTESTDDIVNPDRGFYYPYTTTTSNFVALEKAQLISRRTTSFQGFQAQYSVRTSLAFRHYVLDSFQSTDSLTQTFLDAVQSDFDTARDAGVRLILRFSYTITPISGSCDAGFICPPYGDAPKSRVLSHIAQVKPILQANEDVIMVTQLGWIGTWGENYYTDHFGDPSVNSNTNYLTNQNWGDRSEVVSAMLDAVPQSRSIQVRYPQLKQRFLGGPEAPLSFSATHAEQAFTMADTARIGHHNDCFVASADDFGTYFDYGNDTTEVAAGAIADLKPYQQADTQYTLFGGETCSDSYNPQNNCDNLGGSILAEMESLHLSYLNTDYNNVYCVSAC
ncbi:MAG: DUF4874 domain-containing protein [Pseudomonadota bacterium]